MSGDPFAATAALLLAIGFYGLLAHNELIRRLVATNIIASAVFLLLVRVSLRGSAAPDPIPHAMVLTGIVIAISLTAFALTLNRRFRDLTQRDSLAEDQTGEDADA